MEVKKMKLNKLPIEYQKAIPILKKLESAGFEAYFVGGSVRDILLGQSIHDIDISTNAFPEEIKNLFLKTIDIGVKHGTVLVLENDEQYEITTFRTESTYQDFRRPDTVEFVSSLKEDLKRRDFTINAFALQIDGNIIDLFDGLSDLENHVLRAVGNPHERFHEDALRMLRGIRFISQLGFHLESETAVAIKENHALLRKISVERINSEFIKMLLGKKRSVGLQTLIETRCYIYCPELKKYREALLRFSDLPSIPLETESQAWVLLLSELTLTENEVRSFLKAWKCSNEMIKVVTQLVRGLKIRQNRMLNDYELYQLGKVISCQVEELIVYYKQIPKVTDVKAQYEDLPIKSLKDLAIDGKILLEKTKQKPGKWVSEALHEAEKAVLEKKVKNKTEQLLDYLEL